jgi:hypothetical protein
MLAIYGIAVAVFASNSANTEVSIEERVVFQEEDLVTFITATAGKNGNRKQLVVKKSTALKFDTFTAFVHSGISHDHTIFDLVDVSYQCLTNMMKFLEMEESESMNEIEKPLKSNWVELIQTQYSEFVKKLSMNELLELTVASALMFGGDKKLSEELMASDNNLVDNRMHTLCAARLASILKFEADPRVIANKFKLNYELLLSTEERKRIEKEFAAIVGK